MRIQPTKLWQAPWHLKFIPPIPVISTAILLILFNFQLYSQKPYNPIQVDPLTEPWRWKQFPELMGKGVRCIAETKDGAIWFGVDEGIIKYDGRNWEYFNSKNGFKNIPVNNICIVSNKIYAGSDSGVFVFSKNKWSIVFPVLSDPSFSRLYLVNCMQQLKDGSILASVGFNMYSGILLIRGEKLTFYSTQKTINRLKKKLKNIRYIKIPEYYTLEDKFEVEELFQDNQERIWFSTKSKSKAAYLFWGKFFNNISDSLVFSPLISEKDGMIHGKYTIFNQTSDGNIWVINGDYTKGISIFNGKSWKSFKLSDKVGDDDLHTSIIQTKDGTVWIGGMGNLYALKNNKWEWYKKPAVSVPVSRIIAFQDSKGFIWIIGKQNEVFQVDFSNNTWKTYKYLNFQCQTSDGKKWFISVEGRIVINDKDSWYSYGTENGLPDAPVRIYQTKNKTIWVAGSHKGIASTAYYNGNKWNMQLHPQLSWGVDYRAVFEDNKGDLWFGCCVDINEKKGQLGGIMILHNPGTKNEKWTHINYEGAYRLYNSYGIGQSKDGCMWVGGSRLLKYDGIRWIKGDSLYTIPSYYDYVTSLPNGTLWTGSRYYGIFGYDGKNWTHYTVDNGLISNTIIYILPLSDNNVWVATDKDICRFDGKTWTANIFPAEMTFIREGGDLKTSLDGILWINKAAREWKRRPLKNNLINTEIKEEYLAISYFGDKKSPNTNITEYSKIVTRYGKAVISWKGSDYWKTTPDNRLAYSYRLNGGAWSDFQEKNYETFIGLNSGKYTFEVRARDLDLNIDPTPAVIKFKVLPPIWKEVWFILLMLFFAFIIGYYEIMAIKKNNKLVKLNKSLQQATVQLEKQKKQVLEQNISERENYQAKIKFFTTISHEFRTPLTLISTAADKIGQAPIIEPSNLQRYIHILKKNSNQLLQLINQLMDFKKLDTDSMELYAKKGNIASFIHSICCNFKIQATSNNVDLIFHNQLDNDDAWFDSDKIEKIMYNLLSNALKFTPDGGSIKVTIALNIEDTNPHIFYYISVADTGLGIPEDEIVKIVEPFYQGRTTPVRKYEGTGIGLSLVKNLVDLHQGKLIIRSSSNGYDSDGYNTSFTIKLPFGNSFINTGEINSIDNSNINPSFTTESENNKLQESIISESIFIESRHHPLVLLVEDNEDLSNLICDALKEQFDFILAKNGSEGYDLAIDKLPDLIVSDIMMPVMTGIEMCLKIKNDQHTSHIPIILLTARSADEHKLEGFENGADDYLTKPFSMRLLSARILNLINIRLALRKKFRNEIILQPNAKYVTSAESTFINKVLAIIEENMANPEFDVDTLSKEVGISSRHLLNKLQSLTDHTPVELIRTLRLKRAEQLLAQKSLSISEVAYDVGFSDPNYFGKCFTKQYGKTPKEYIATGGINKE